MIRYQRDGLEGRCWYLRGEMFRSMSCENVNDAAAVAEVSELVAPVQTLYVHLLVGKVLLSLASEVERLSSLASDHTMPPSAC